MRIVVAGLIATVTLAAATAAEARCEACPKGFTFWHSKNACMADDGSGAMTEPLYWKDTQHGHGAKQKSQGTTADR